MIMDTDVKMDFWYIFMVWYPSKMTTHQTTWYHNPEDHSVNLYHHETFKFYIWPVLFFKAQLIFFGTK